MAAAAWAARLAGGGIARRAPCSSRRGGAGARWRGPLGGRHRSLASTAATTAARAGRPAARSGGALLAARVVGASWKVVKYSYAGLAVIPVSLTPAAGYHWSVQHPPQVARAHLFFAWTGFLCLPLSVVLLASAPLVYLLDWEKRAFFDGIQRTWARWTVQPFWSPEVNGLDKAAALLGDGKAVVYVSNHKSWADIYSLLCLPLPIRFISKEEIFYIPVCGWAMGLIGHVGVQRSSKSSRGSVVDTCVQRLREGVSVFIFAEGTRSRDGYVQPFKRGAFLIAQESGALVVPISISGTGKLMPPNRGETWLERGDEAPVTITFHDPIDPATCASAEDLQAKTRQAIEAGITSY